MDSAKELSGALSRSLESIKRSAQAIEYCPKCKYSKDMCQCSEIAIEKERIEANKVKWDIERLGGLRAYKFFTWDNFNSSDKNTNAVRIAKAFDHKKQNLFIFGPTGAGKTHLSVALAREVKSAKLYKMFNILRALRSATEATQEQKIINALTNRPVVILDDLGSEKGTEYAWTVLYEIIDGRYMNLINGLIVTLNLSLNELAEKLGDDRIPSRLAEMCTILNLTDEKDYRNEKAKSNRATA